MLNITIQYRITFLLSVHKIKAINFLYIFVHKFYILYYSSYMSKSRARLFLRILGHVDKNLLEESLKSY